MHLSTFTVGCGGVRGSWAGKSRVSRVSSLCEADLRLLAVRAHGKATAERRRGGKTAKGAKRLALFRIITLLALPGGQGCQECQRVCTPSWHPSDNCAAISSGRAAGARKPVVRGHAEGKMLNEHLGGAIISLF